MAVAHGSSQACKLAKAFRRFFPTSNFAMREKRSSRVWCESSLNVWAIQTRAAAEFLQQKKTRVFHVRIAPEHSHLSNKNAWGRRRNTSLPCFNRPICDHDANDTADSARGKWMGVDLADSARGFWIGGYLARRMQESSGWGLFSRSIPRFFQDGESRDGGPFSRQCKREVDGGYLADCARGKWDFGISAAECAQQEVDGGLFSRLCEREAPWGLFSRQCKREVRWGLFSRSLLQEF